MNAPVHFPRIEARTESLRIAGKKVAGEAGTLDVFDPYTGAVAGTVPRASARQGAEAFRIAAAYKPKLTRYDRQKILMRTGELIASRKEVLAKLITAESGLSLKDSYYEVGRAYDVWTLAGQLAIREDAETFACDITPHGKPRRIHTLREPLQGAISAITPFNHPLNMVSHKLAPAFATNNRVVLKPTELTPLTALALADILYEAGLPPEMLSVVTGSPADLGDAMIVDPNIDLVTFTGSVGVGKMIAQK
ncbi:MAG: aldehyde dehydrogenase family protein, partial [Tagaea sp.]